MLRNLFVMLFCCSVAPAAFADEPPVQAPVQLAMLHGPAAASCLQSPADPDAFDYRLQQAQCVTVGNAQMFEFENDVGGGYRIRNVQADACIDVVTFSPPGAPVIHLPCNGQNNQRWDIAYSEGNPSVAMMRSAMTGLCLGFADGIAVQQSCDLGAGIGPEWSVSRQSARAPEGSLALRAVHDGKCMNLEGTPKTEACSNNGETSLRFGPLDAAGTTFRFNGAADGTCLVQLGDTLTYDTCITGASAHWRIVEAGWETAGPSGEKAVRWQVQNVASNQCLHAGRGIEGPDGQTLTVEVCDFSPNSEWTFLRY